MTERSKVQNILGDMLENFSLMPSRNDLNFAHEGRAITHRLYVHPNGSGLDGLSWVTAYTRIQDALNVMSTRISDLTLILIAPLTTANNYDIYMPGNPTWAGNCILMGSHRTWTKIMNTHPTATSIMTLTGLAKIQCLNFNLGSGSCNGVIMSGAAPRVIHCQFVGGDLTGAATALELSRTQTQRHGKVIDTHFLGGLDFMRAIYLNNVSNTDFMDIRIHYCVTGIQIVGEDPDSNLFRNVDIGDCVLALDLDDGSEQHFQHINLHHNNTNVDDEVGDHIWEDIRGAFPVTIEPDNFTGVDLITHANPNEWGNDIEIRAVATSTVPFSIVGFSIEADATEKFRIRLSADSGATFFVDKQIEGNLNVVKREALPLPSGTEFIFNEGTRISGSSKSESGGNTATIWLEIQPI